AEEKIGCATIKAPLSYLGSKVDGLMSHVQSWNEIVNNLVAYLSNWKMKTLSIVPMKVLQRMESIRCHFFNGVDHNGKKLIWVKWSKVLASKEKGGLGVSSFYELNKALLFKYCLRDATQELRYEFDWFYSQKDRVYALKTYKNDTVVAKMSHVNVGYCLR
ncbi:hypothetical protein Tco_1455448, partial [Tanacetum coccineum]